MRGVSTRAYTEVIPSMAETCGVSRSSVSREFVEAGAEALRSLCERRLEGTEFLILYIWRPSGWASGDRGSWGG